MKTKLQKKEARNHFIRLLIIVVGVLTLLAGCTSRTEFGDCIGLADDRQPNLIYKVSAWNIVVAILGFEMIAPPIFVAVDETFCPIGKKDEVKKNDIPPEPTLGKFPGS